MKKKIAFVTVFFGELPNYFQIFLDSCSYNTDFDWLIISDNTNKYALSENVRFIKMSFEDCKQRIQSCFDFKITLHTPQKLCDYKCAYGYIFSDFLEKYDWWGHCDLDQIFGNLNSFINEELLNNYEKIGSIGHMTLYRNTSENNCVFMNGGRYREVFTTERGCGFDEWLQGNVNDIYIQSERPVFLENLGADVNAYHTSFQLVEFDLENGVYVPSAIKNSIFLWNKGELVQIYMEKEQVKFKEYPYIHLQKRAMTDKRDCIERDKFYIIPNQFINCNMAPEIVLKKIKWYNVFNTQFLKVKWKNLRYRFKSGDWKFDNVFRK